MNILGLMSGTSMDGLDLCLANLSINQEQELIYKIIASDYIEYDQKTKSIIHDTIFYNSYTESFIDSYLGELFANKVVDFIGKNNVDLISSHGQTISHKDREYSIQVGQPNIISEKTKTSVISHFRQKDIDFGGNGAPLMPLLDWFLFKSNKTSVISINIGGISNIAFISNNIDKKNILGFDIGPGMCLIDRYVRKIWKKKYDVDGLLSSKGKIDLNLLKFLMQDPFVNKEPPKSATTEIYNDKYIDNINDKFSNINNKDILRTLVNFTALSISYNLKNHIPDNGFEQFEVAISGGGIKNKVLFSDIKNQLNGINVYCFNMNGLNTDNKEAFLMCLMGYTKFMNIPNNLPSVTGAHKEVVCGEIYEF